jgi:hypothetical protein
MRGIALYLIVFLLFVSVLRTQAQTNVGPYTINADTVTLTSCDSSEVVIRNHTNNVPGFLFNTGNGLTIFKHALQPIGSNAWVIGSDTLNLGSKAWLQGGNTFGGTGVLGTLDNNNLDLYTADTGRVRVVPRGRVLIGTTADDSVHLLQVHGASAFSGNVNIGTATITNGGSLIGTNAILFNHVVSQIPNYQVNDIYISKLDNVFWNYQYRFQTTSTTGADGTVTIVIKIPRYEFGDSTGILYPGGKMCFSFWEHYVPQLISVQLYDSVHPRWNGPFTTSTNLAPGNTGYFEVTIPQSFNYASAIQIVMTPLSGGVLDLQNIEYVLTNPGTPRRSGFLRNPYPYVSKYNSEYLYSNLFFGTAGNVIACLSPSAGSPSYFLSSIGIGTNTPTAQLHTTGSMRFSGLTQDSTRTRVLVSDDSGNVYYRSAASLAFDNPLRSSLAVNGTVKSRKIIISPDE